MLPGLRSTGLLGAGALVAPFDSSPSFKGASIVLSDSDTVAFWPSGSGGQNARTLKRYASNSLRYVEFKIVTFTSGNIQIGPCNDSLTPTGTPGSTVNAFSYRNDGTRFNNGVQASGLPAYGQGDVIGVLLDNSGSTSVKLYKNGVLATALSYPSGGGPWSAYALITGTAGGVIAINKTPQYTIIGAAGPSVYWSEP